MILQIIDTLYIYIYILFEQKLNSSIILRIRYKALSF